MTNEPIPTEVEIKKEQFELFVDEYLKSNGSKEVLVKYLKQFPDHAIELCTEIIFFLDNPRRQYRYENENEKHQEIYENFMDGRENPFSDPDPYNGKNYKKRIYETAKRFGLEEQEGRVKTIISRLMKKNNKNS
jgi:hypothetical protein